MIMNQASPHLWKGSSSALPQVKWEFRQGSMGPLEKDGSAGVDLIEADEPETELFALAGEVDFAERIFHDTNTRRNEAQIAYLRAPSVTTRDRLEMAKVAEKAALEFLGGEIQRLAGIRATTVTGLKLKASYASTAGKLADSIVEDILQL
jgi:hypothetical protein